jgi:hypothetical protein
VSVVRFCAGCPLTRRLLLRGIAFFETFMVKSYETLVDSDTRVDVNTGIVAASRLHAVTGSRDYSIDIAEMVARIPRRRARCA